MLTATKDIEQGERAGKPRLTRRRLITGAAGLVGLTASATAAYAGAIEPFGLVVTPYAFTPPGWMAGRKLTISVIADLHAGGPDMTLPHVRRVVDTANALRSDLVVLLGDFKAWYQFKTEPVADQDWSSEIARLQAPLGIWAILGNHDWWHDLEGVRNALADMTSRSWKTTPCCSGRRDNSSGSPESAIRLHIG